MNDYFAPDRKRLVWGGIFTVLVIIIGWGAIALLHLPAWLAWL